MKIIDELAQSMEMDDKSVYSHKVYITVAFIAAIAAGVMEALCLILYFFNSEAGLYVYSLLFYPTAILLIVTFFFSIPELLRNVYWLSLVTLMLAGIMTVLLIVSIFLQAFFLGSVYIIPFVFL